MAKPNIVIVNDYDGYFQRWSEKLAEELEKVDNEVIKTIRVDSGPYRNSGLSYSLSKDGVLDLDFYSAVRTGFGSIGVTQEDLAKELVA